MAIDFFTFWVSEVCGSALISLFVTAAILAFIGVVGRMSYMLLTTLLILYFITFGVGFYGIIIYLPLMIISALYFGFQLFKFMIRE